jgi:hypothetical protein
VNFVNFLVAFSGGHASRDENRGFPSAHWGPSILSLSSYTLLGIVLQELVDWSFWPWPPRSPDPTLLHFFLWGIMKEMFYKTKVPMRVELLHRIMNATAYIQEHPKMMQRAVNSYSDLDEGMH